MKIPSKGSYKKMRSFDRWNAKNKIKNAERKERILENIKAKYTPYERWIYIQVKLGKMTKEKAKELRERIEKSKIGKKKDTFGSNQKCRKVDVVLRS